MSEISISPLISLGSNSSRSDESKMFCWLFEIMNWYIGLKTLESSNAFVFSNGTERLSVSIGLKFNCAVPLAIDSICVFILGCRKIKYRKGRSSLRWGTNFATRWFKSRLFSHTIPTLPTLPVRESSTSPICKMQFVFIRCGRQSIQDAPVESIFPSWTFLMVIIRYCPAGK